MMAQQAAKFARRNAAITAQQTHQRGTVHHVLRTFHRLSCIFSETFRDLQATEQLRKGLHPAQSMRNSSQIAALHRPCPRAVSQLECIVIDTQQHVAALHSQMAGSTVCAAPSKRSPAGPHRCWLCSDPLLQLSVQQARPPPAGVAVSASIARYQALHRPQRCPCLLLVASLCKLGAVGDVKHVAGA